MKFGNLLAAGKSLVNGNTAGRYQMEKNFRLPQFISPRNPFQRSAAATPATPPPGLAAPRAKTDGAATAGGGLAEVAPCRESGGAESVLVSSAQAGFGSRGQATTVWQRVGVWGQRAAMFCLDHNPFSAIGKPRLAGIPRFGKPAVQGELSLERGAELRTELRHAELETARVGVK